MRLLPNSTLPSTEYTVCVALTLEGVPSHDSRSSVETEGKNYLAVPSSSAQSSVSCDDKRHKEPASASSDLSNGYFKCIIFIKGVHSLQEIDAALQLGVCACETCRGNIGLIDDSGHSI